VEGETAAGAATVPDAIGFHLPPARLPARAIAWHTMARLVRRRLYAAWANGGTMAFRIKNMSRGGWIVVGILIAVMLVPSGVAVAKALKYTGIEGTSTNRADVTPAGQLLTTEAQPSNLLGGSSSDSGFFSATSTVELTGLFSAPSNEAVVMDAITLDVAYWDTSAGPNTYYDLYISDDACTLSDQVGYWTPTFSPNGYGSTEIPLTPGVGIPAGDTLCAYSYASSGEFQVHVFATGSLVPSGSVPEVKTHSLLTLKR
jgi:hypothetical protein